MSMGTAMEKLTKTWKFAWNSAWEKAPFLKAGALGQSRGLRENGRWAWGRGGHLFCGKTTLEHQAVHKVTPGHENPKSTFVPETFQTKFYKKKGQGRGEEEKEKGKETMKRTK